MIVLNKNLCVKNTNKKKCKKYEINTSVNARMITNSTKNKYTSNIFIMQHSKNVLLQTSQPTINIILDNIRNNYINDLKSMNNFNNNNLYNNFSEIISCYVNNINNKSNYSLKNFLIINSNAYLENIVNILIGKIFFINTYKFNYLTETNKIKNKI